MLQQMADECLVNSELKVRADSKLVVVVESHGRKLNLSNSRSYQSRLDSIGCLSVCVYHHSK